MLHGILIGSPLVLAFAASSLTVVFHGQWPAWTLCINTIYCQYIFLSRIKLVSGLPGMSSGFHFVVRNVISFFDRFPNLKVFDFPNHVHATITVLSGSEVAKKT